jgi:hypothetical protein
MLINVEKFEWIDKVDSKNLWKLTTETNKTLFVVLANESHESEKINNNVRQIDDNFITLHDDFNFLLESLRSELPSKKIEDDVQSITLSEKLILDDKFFIKIGNALPLYLLLRKFVVRRRNKKFEESGDDIYNCFYIKQRKLVSIINQKKIADLLGYKKGGRVCVSKYIKELEKLGVIKKHKWYVKGYLKINIYELGYHDFKKEYWFIDEVKF